MSLFTSWKCLVALLLAGLLAAGGWWFAQRPQANQDSAAIASCTLPAQAAGKGPPGMVWVPAGSFAMGDSSYPEALPIHRTSVAGFWMDRTEVSNADFAAFVKATGYITVAERPVDASLYPHLPAEMRQPGAVVFAIPAKLDAGGDITQWWRYVPGANWRHPGGPHTSIVGHGAFPVVTVTYEDARAYAAWRGRALPSEAQWEWAARSARDQPAPEHEQPAAANTWQGLFPLVNSGKDGFVGLAPSGCYAANGLGLFDMIGNVWELTGDAWRPGHGGATAAHPDQVPASLQKAATGATTTALTGQRVIKGGSFLCAPNYCMRYRAGARQPQEEDLAVSHVGFRTVLPAP